MPKPRRKGSPAAQIVGANLTAIWNDRPRSEHQDDVAKALGVGQGKISEWFAGTSLPAAPSIAALALYFGVRAEAILEGLATREAGRIRTVSSRKERGRKSATTKRAAGE